MKIRPRGRGHCAVLSAVAEREVSVPASAGASLLVVESAEQKCDTRS